MKVIEIREIAKKHGLGTGKMKKSELIRAIQKAERNDQCFNTGISSVCGEETCLWGKDCDVN